MTDEYMLANFANDGMHNHLYVDVLVDVKWKDFYMDVELKTDYITGHM